MLVNALIASPRAKINPPLIRSRCRGSSFGQRLETFEMTPAQQCDDECLQTSRLIAICVRNLGSTVQTQEMKVLLWNIEWANRASTRGERIQSIILEAAVDVVCLKETTVGMIPNGGHSITSEADYGYTHNGSRRKVALWSNSVWTSSDVVGSIGLPRGRFCTGITCGVRFVGICILAQLDRRARFQTSYRADRCWRSAAQKPWASGNIVNPRNQRRARIGLYSA